MNTLCRVVCSARVSGATLLGSWADARRGYDRTIRIEPELYRYPAIDPKTFRRQVDRVMLTKARRSTTTDDPFRTFEEWSSEADNRAYADL